MYPALTVAMTAALLLVTASSASAAAIKAKDGFWRTSMDGALVELHVANHRVVAVSARVDTTTVGAPDNACGTQTYAFLGPFGPRASTLKAFTVDDGATGWGARGTFTSAKKLTGTVQVFASSRNQCAAKVKFTAAFDSAD